MLEIKTSPTIHMYNLPSRMGFTSCPMMAGGLSHEAAKEVAASVGHVDGVVPVVGRAEAPRTETVRSEIGENMKHHAAVQSVRERNISRREEILNNF